LELHTLSVADVLLIYERLLEHFVIWGEPVSPAGLRSEALLESAVSRQLAGLGATLKYPGPIENAATLVFGLCRGHPFYNGNKRTALIALLLHLARNGYSLGHASDSDLVDILLQVASGGQGVNLAAPERAAGAADDEVAAFAHWIRSLVSAADPNDRREGTDYFIEGRREALRQLARL
jgi:death-on-curing protein